MKGLKKTDFPDNINILQFFSFETTLNSIEIQEAIMFHHLTANFFPIKLFIIENVLAQSPFC